MSINRILRDLEKEFKKASDTKDYSIVDKLFYEALPQMQTDKYDEKLTDFLHKLKEKNVLTHKQFIDYRAKQVKYSIDLIKIKSENQKKDDDIKYS